MRLPAHRHGQGQMLHTVGDVPGGEQLLAQLDLSTRRSTLLQLLQPPTSCRKNLCTASWSLKSGSWGPPLSPPPRLAALRFSRNFRRKSG